MRGKEIDRMGRIRTGWKQDRGIRGEIYRFVVEDALEDTLRDQLII